MREALLFPGQGAQYVGMGRDLYDAFPEARKRLEQADQILDRSLTSVMFGTASTDEKEAKAQLRATENTQPALFTHSMAAYAVLQKADIRPAMTAGHSLGEYSALVAAGALSFEEGLQAVAKRGQYMARAGQSRQGTMAALLGMDEQVVETLCKEVSSTQDGVVQPANYNAPGQIVISGDVAAVKQAVARTKEEGLGKAIPLSVSGAFHSPLMAEAREDLRETLEQLSITTPACPVYLNVSAAPTQDPDTIRKGLLEQLTAPVRWAQSLQQMQSDGAERYVEVGAGKVLSGLVKRTLGRRTSCERAGTDKQVQELLAAQQKA